MTKEIPNNYETGDPVTLTNANDLGKYGFRKGIKGTVNRIENIEGSRLVLFMPNYTQEMYWIDSSRVELDEVAKANKIPVLPPEEG
jgi:hypothetical protein